MTTISTTRGKGFKVCDKKQTERDRIDSINQKKGMIDNALGEKRIAEPDPLPRNIDEVEKPVDEADKPSDDAIIKFKPSELTTYLQAAVDKAKRETLPELERLKAEATSLKKQAETDKARLESELAEIKSDAAAKAKVLEGVFGTLGMPIPTDGVGRNVYIAQQETRGGISATDAAKELNKIWEATPGKICHDKNSGSFIEQRDLFQFDRFIRQNSDAVREGMEAHMKSKYGLFKGNSFTDAATARTDIPPAFLDYLSSRTRMSHSQKYIWWQFAQVEIDAQKGIGDTIQIARILNQVAGVSETEWDLTGLTLLSTTDNPIQARSVSVKIKEYGLGKGANKQPITVSEFLMARSLLDLEQALQMALGRDYFEFEDVVIRNYYLQTTQARYNQKNSLLTAPASFAAGDDGTLTYNFLNNLYADMCANQIPAFENGKYAIVVNPYALAQLKTSLGAQNQYLDRNNLEELTNIFNALTAEEGYKISGYEFNIGNFMVFCSNNLGVGSVGVNTITAAGSPRTFRSSIAFGGGAVGRGIGMPMSIRRDNNDDFGRRNRFTWISHEGFGMLDVDSAIVPATDMQTRVFEIRSADVAF